MAFLALVTFVLLIGGWVYSARGLFAGLFGFLTGERSVVSTVVVESVQYDTASLYGASVAAAGGGAREEHAPAAAVATAEVGRPGPPPCTVEIEVCTVDAVRARQVESGCAVVCK